MNWGWALAPQPFSISPDGSGLEVYVDGTYLGHPTYNLNRADIAGLFPGRTNSTGSVGYLSIDTTRFANGVHTIAWVVRDQNGHADGIGSRYFTVLNATTAAMMTTTAARSVQLAASMAAGSTAAATVRSRVGFDLERNLREVEANDTGGRLVAASELERVELSVGESGFAAAMLVSSRLSPLPAGSRFDAKTGTLVWQPGVGFAGRYDFVFTRGDERIPVTVMLAAKHAAASRVEFTIDTPMTGSTAAGVVTVAGWAFDRGATRGSGVDAVHIWAYPAGGGDPIFAGAASLGGFRPDVAAAVDAAGTTSGFGLTVGHLPAGTYDLAVFPRSSVSGVFADAQVVRVTIR